MKIETDMATKVEKKLKVLKLNCKYSYIGILSFYKSGI